jgi:hypothetical protein
MRDPGTAVVTRRRAAVYAAFTAVEVAYILHANLPSLVPAPCRRMILDGCVSVGPFPWLWLGVALLLVLSAIAILLRKEAGIATAFVAQGLALVPLVRDLARDVGAFLSTGSLYSGVDPDYRDLAFITLALAIAIGPALTVLFLMSSRSAPVNPRAARVAAILMGIQVAVLVVTAVVVFRATFRDCEHGGLGTVFSDGVAGCPDYADLDVGSVIATVVPTGAVLIAICVAVWYGRSPAIAGGIVWQVLLAVALAALGVALSTEPSQNAWYDRFPSWTSPRYLAYAILIAVPAPTLAALLTARSRRQMPTSREPGLALV